MQLITAVKIYPTPGEDPLTNMNAGGVKKYSAGALNVMVYIGNELCGETPS